MVITPAMPVGADFLKAAPIESRRMEPTQPVDDAPVSRRSDDVRKSEEETPVDNEKRDDDSDEDDFSDVLNQAMMASGQVQQVKAEVPKDAAKKDVNLVADVSAKAADAKSESQTLTLPEQTSDTSAQKQNAAAALTDTTPVKIEPVAVETKEQTDSSVEELLKPLLNAQQTQATDNSRDVLQQPVQKDPAKTEVVSSQPTNTVSETLSELRLSAIQTTKALEASKATEAAATAAPVLKVTKPSDALMTIQADPDDVTEKILSALQRSMESPVSATTSAMGSSSSGVAVGTIATSGQRSNNVSTGTMPGGLPAGTVTQTGIDTAAIASLSATMTQGGDLSGQRNSGSESGSSAQQSLTSETAGVTSSSGNTAASASSAGVVSSSATSDFASTVASEVRQPLSAQVSRAVLEHLERGSSSDNDRLTVRLDPPELGEMTIELSKTKDGLAVRVTAREAVTMDMLLARGSEIEQQLKSQDLNLKALEFLSPGMMGQSDSSSSQRRESSDTRESSMGLRSVGGRRGVNGSAGSRGVSATAVPQESSNALSFRA